MSIMPKSRDLFDDTTMTFGEHLEVLRVHVFRAIVGVVLAVTVALFFGDRIFYWLRNPIETALRERGIENLTMDVPKQSFTEYLKQLFSGRKLEEPKLPDEQAPTIVETLRRDQLRVMVSRRELMKALEKIDPAAMPLPVGVAEAEAGSNALPDQSAETVTPTVVEKEADEQVELVLTAPEFAQLQRVIEDTSRITTFRVEEGFMAYMKVCFFAGLLVSSPWVFYQLWLFVAAGLYPHERKYIHIYMPMSVVLFLAGALAGYFYAFPLMLDFLIGFNQWLGIMMQPRLSEYISMAMLMPLMFGVSFQLPLVMLFLERIGICTVATYKENWRIAVLVISVVSMVLTTSPDPWSMMLMMIPLLVLYVFGIFLCQFRPAASASPVR